MTNILHRKPEWALILITVDEIYGSKLTLRQLRQELNLVIHNSTPIGVVTLSFAVPYRRAVLKPIRAFCSVLETFF
jgi:hypothetical protein